MRIAECGLRIETEKSDFGFIGLKKCRSRSIADYISKMGIVEEESDESLYWMELLIEAGIDVNTKMEALMREAGELLAITVASIKTAKKSKNLPRRGTTIGQILTLNPQSQIRIPK